MKNALCHPERRHYAKGLCEACWRRERYNRKLKGYYQQRYIENSEQFREYSRGWRKRNPGAARAKGTLQHRFGNLLQVSKKRRLECTLAFEDFLKLAAQKCTYCNGFFGGSKTGYGLDRVDNSVGYTRENVVSCCPTCNKIKSDHLTFEETCAAVRAIITVRQGNQVSNECR